MDGNRRPESNGKFVRSSDPDFYIPSGRKPQNRNSTGEYSQSQSYAKGGKASGRNNSKPPYAGKKNVRGNQKKAPSSGSRSPRRQPYGGSRRSISDEKYRQYMYQVRKKQVMRNRIIAGVVLSVLVISAVVFSLSLTVWFHVEELEINSNDSSYSAKEIKEASRLDFGAENLLRCDLTKAENNIEKALPYIGKVTAKRKLPHTVVVDVEKTAAVAAVQYGRFVLLINEEGKILQEVAEVPFGLRLVKYGTLSQAEPGEIMASKNGVPVSVYVSIMKAMHDNKLNDITVIDISVPDKIILTYQDRIDIKLGRAEDINVKIGVAVKALTDEDSKYSVLQKGTLDLTYDLNKAYFIPYAEKEEQTENTEETTATNVFDSPLKPQEEDQTKSDGENGDDGEEKVTEKKKEKTTSETTKKQEEKAKTETSEEKTEKREEKTSTQSAEREKEKTEAENNNGSEHGENRENGEN